MEFDKLQHLANKEMMKYDISHTNVVNRGPYYVAMDGVGGRK